MYLTAYACVSGANCSRTEDSGEGACDEIPGWQAHADEWGEIVHMRARKLVLSFERSARLTQQKRDGCYDNSILLFQLHVYTPCCS